MDEVVLMILQGMASALGQRLLSRTKPDGSIAISELAEEAARSARSAQESAAAVERSIAAFVEILERHHEFVIRTTPELEVSLSTAQGSAGRSLLSLDREIAALRQQSGAPEAPPEPVPRAAGASEGFDLEALDAEIAARRRQG